MIRLFFFLSDSNTFLISILWFFETFSINLNFMTSFYHHWFITILWIFFVINIKFLLLAVIYNNLTFNYCMILLIFWKINCIIIVNLEDCYSSVMQLYVNLDLSRDSKLLKEKKCDEKIISIVFSLMKVTCVIIQIHSLCFVCK